MSMFTYNLTLATEEPLERVRDRVSAFFPEVEWTNGEANLGGWIVVVSSPSTYQPSVLYANEMLGRSATAEVSFLVSKGLDVEAACPGIAAISLDAEEKSIAALAWELRARCCELRRW